MADEETLNTRLPKAILDILGPKGIEIIEQKDQEIEEDTKVADDENEESAVRERAREIVTESAEKRPDCTGERTA